MNVHYSHWLTLDFSRGIVTGEYVAIFKSSQLIISHFIHSFHWHVQNATILAVLRSFFHSSLLCNFSCHPSPPTTLQSPLTSSCHPFLGLPLNLDVPKFIYSTLLGILFPSIPCTCSHHSQFYFLPFSVHAQTNVIYLTLLSLL